MTNITPPSGDFDPPYPGTPFGSDASPNAATYGSTPPQYSPAGRPVGEQAKYGKIGTIIAVIGTVLVALQNLVLRIFITGLAGEGSGRAVVDVYGIFTVVTFAITVAALIFGLIGMRRDRDRLFAGIALGFGGLGVAAYLLSWMIDVIPVF